MRSALGERASDCPRYAIATRAGFKSSPGLAGALVGGRGGGGAQGTLGRENTREMHA